MAHITPSGGGASGTSLPSGGTTGQALTKHSNTDNDTQWSSVAALSNATPVAPGVAAAGTGSSASRDDHVHPPSGLPWKSGYMYAAPGPTASFAPTNNKMVVLPIYVANTVTIASLRARVNTTQAGSTIRFVIYADSAGYPGALVYGGPQVATAATNVPTDTPGSTLTLTPGWYWVGVVPQASGSVAAMTYVNGGGFTGIIKAGPGVDVGTNYGAIGQTGVTSTPPGTFSAGGVTDDPAIRVFLEVA